MSTIPPSSPAAGRRLLLDRLDEALAGVDRLVDLEEERFLATHVLYEGRSNQQRRIVEWFGEHVEPTAGQPYRVLSIGCGSGILDVPVARDLSRKTDQLRYWGVDPNVAECRAFADAFARAAPPGASLELSAVPFEAFDPSPSFDLVHLVHCLYYLPDAAGALQKARRLVAPGGRLVVFHAPCEALNDLSSRFYDKRYERPTLFARDLAALFDKWGWAYDRARIDARVDLTPFVNGDPVLGPMLRDFIVQVDAGALPEAVRNLVDAYLGMLVTRTPDGAATVDHPVDVFVIGG